MGEAAGGDSCLLPALFPKDGQEPIALEKGPGGAGASPAAAVGLMGGHGDGAKARAGAASRKGWPLERSPASPFSQHRIPREAFALAVPLGHLP